MKTIKILFLLTLVLFCRAENLFSEDIFDQNKIIIKKSYSLDTITSLEQLESACPIDIIPIVNEPQLFHNLVKHLDDCTAINIDCKYITGIDSLLNILGNLLHLEYLGIENLYDETLPNIFHKFKELKVLIMFNCLSLTSLPPSFSSLSNLIMLRIDSFRIEKFPEEIFCLKELTDLDLSFPKVKKIPKEIENLINLETLRITWGYYLEFPNEINNLKKLRYILLSSIANLDLKHIFKVFSKIENLEYLVLSYCDISELPDEISYMTNIKRLSISNDTIFNLSYINKNLFKLKNLKELSLTGNTYEILDEDICLLKNLELLSLDRCKQLHTLPDCLRNMKSLKQLNLWNTNISEDKLTILKRTMPNTSVSPNPRSEREKIIPLKMLRKADLLSEKEKQNNNLKYYINVKNY